MEEKELSWKELCGLAYYLLGEGTVDYDIWNMGFLSWEKMYLTKCDTDSLQREKAIEFIRNITSGKGFDWTENLGPIQMAELAKGVWFNGEFNYGMEYGAIIALAYVFDITEEELKGEEK